MNSIDIISHCYAEKHRHYADGLYCQLSSIVLDKPNCDVTVTVCYLSTDVLVRKVLSTFEDRVNIRHISTPDIHMLGRRSILRNRASSSSHSDIVWFADSDQAFYRGCLNNLSHYQWTDESLIYPKSIKISRDHNIGDAQTGLAAKLLLTGIPVKIDDDGLFIDHHYNRAIGGVQIVRGEFARDYGYLRESQKYQKPAKIPFGDFRDDVVFRDFCSSFGSVRGIDLVGLYRIRHSECSYKS